MVRVRRLNFSEQTGGTNLTPRFTIFTGAWDLETDIEPRFTRKTPVPMLFPMAAFMPLSVSWDVLTDASLVVLTDSGGDPLTGYYS